mmetsp:Transcript_4432/g.11627  ORF Transcript_4432/g.11627 Transcript_4432/m.11627 type:complete len:264 (+) Transcript_4432:95-886(+)
MTKSRHAGARAPHPPRPPRASSVARGGRSNQCTARSVWPAPIQRSRSAGGTQADSPCHRFGPLRPTASTHARARERRRRRTAAPVAVARARAPRARPRSMTRRASARHARLVGAGARLRLRLPLLLLDGQEELELGRQLLLRVEAVRKVDATDAAVGVDLDTERLDVVRAVRTTRKVRQVELDLVPALVEAHRHRANERLHARGRLVVGGAEAAADILVVKHLHLEGEVLFQILDNHDEERELDAQRAVGMGRARHIRRRDVR